MNKSMKTGFTPISMEQGVRCTCGNPIWVIGSAVMGNACFTCITGESRPDDDYEIDEAMS